MFKKIRFETSIWQDCLNQTDLKTGANKVKLSAKDRNVFFHVIKADQNGLAANEFLFSPDFQPKNGSDFFPLFFLLAFLALIGFLVYRLGAIDGIIQTVLVFFVVFSISPVLLFFLGLPWNFFWVVLSVIIGFVAWFFWVPKNFAKKPDKSDSHFLLLASLWLVLLTVILFFLPSHQTPWNVFYERQSKAVLDFQGPVFFDS